MSPVGQLPATRSASNGPARARRCRPRRRADEDHQPADVRERHRAQPALVGIRARAPRRRRRVRAARLPNVSSTGRGAARRARRCGRRARPRPRRARAAERRAALLGQRGADDRLGHAQQLLPLARSRAAGRPASRRRAAAGRRGRRPRSRGPPAASSATRSPGAAPRDRAGWRRAWRPAAARVGQRAPRASPAPPRSGRARRRPREPGIDRSIRVGGYMSTRMPVDLDPRRRVRRHPLRDVRRRDRQDHDRPPRGAQRLPPADPRRVSEALERAREDPDVGVIILTGEGPLAFCSGGDQRVRGDAGYVGGAARAVGRFHVTDLHVQIRRLPKPVVAMVAGYAIGGGHVLHVVCDLTIAADNARFGQTGPRVGSFDGGFGAGLLREPGRAEEGEGDLVPVPPVRRAAGARDGARQHRRAARAARGGDGRSGAARCSRCRRSRCGC